MALASRAPAVLPTVRASPVPRAAARAVLRPCQQRAAAAPRRLHSRAARVACAAEPRPEERDAPPARSTLSAVGHWLADAAAEIFSPVDDHGASFSGTMMPYSGEPLQATDRHRLARVEQVVLKARKQLTAEEAAEDDAAIGAQGALTQHAEGAEADDATARDTHAPDLGALPRAATPHGGVQGHARVARGRSLTRQPHRRRRALPGGGGGHHLLQAGCQRGRVQGAAQAHAAMRFQGAANPADSSAARAQGTLAGWSGDVVPRAQRKKLVVRLDKLQARIKQLETPEEEQKP
jgi:hypothetical protein